MRLLRRKIINGCEQRGDAESPYLTRWTLIDTGRWAMYLHIFHRSDNVEHHDHPWDFVSFILWRGYFEETYVTAWCHGRKLRPSHAGRKRVWPGMLLFRRAEWRHRVVLVHEKPAVTLVLRRNYRREWGFFTSKGWQGWQAYFKERGCK